MAPPAGRLGPGDRPGRARAAWDAAIARADDEFLDKMHMMVCGSDCHSHVARVLNLLKLGGCTCHNKVELAAYVFFCGRHIGIGGFIATVFIFIL